jgi:V/A-type H+-transporting ATPase subunit E
VDNSEGEMRVKALETGKDKIQKICDALRKETLEPAKQEAQEIVENGKLQAQNIVEHARKKAEAILAEAEAKCDEKKKLVDSSLQFAAKQVVEELKQKIETGLFSPAVADLVAKETANPHLIAEIIASFLKMIERQGLQEDWVIAIPKNITPQSIAALVAGKVAKRLEEKNFILGDFDGGAQIHFKKHHITIDLSNKAVQELVAGYIRRDLRDLIFGH